MKYLYLEMFKLKCLMIKSMLLAAPKNSFENYAINIKPIDK
jgi:hypothetical protein